MNTSRFNDDLETIQRLCQRLVCGAVLGALGLIVSGCHHSYKRYGDYPASTPFNSSVEERYEDRGVGRFKSRYMVQQMENYYRGGQPGPIGVATFVNLDDLYTTSTFGRVYAEQVMSELAMAGFDVVELRHADALQFLSSNGEFALSRDVSVLRRERGLGGVVVGTYAASPDRVYVNARLVDPTNSMILTVGSVEMPRSKEITRMLRGGTYGSTLERIPVRHLGLQQFPMYGGPSHGGGAPHRWDVEEQAMNSAKRTMPTLDMEVSREEVSPLPIPPDLLVEVQ